MAEYELLHASPAEVVVRQPRRNRVVLMLLALLAAAAVGLALLLVRGVLRLETGPAIPLLALLGFVGAVLGAILVHRQPAHQLRFDACRGTIEVAALPDTRQAAAPVAWPLAACRAVETRATRLPSGGGGTTWHHVEVRMHDGALLPLLRTKDAAQCDHLAAILRTMIAESATTSPVRLAPPALPACVQLQRTRDETVLTWDTALDRRSIASLALVALSLVGLAGTLARAMASTDAGLHWSPLLVVMLWALTPAVLLGAALVRQVRAHPRRHHLTISDDAVRYVSAGTMLGARGEWTMARDTLAAVRLVWGEGALEFPARDAGEVARPAARGIAPAPGGRASMTTIRLGGWPLADLVALEQWLQGELTVRWGREVA